MPLNTRCPNCKTEYLVDSAELMGASGMAHCYRCGTLFDVLTEKASGPEDDEILLIQSSIKLDHRSEVHAQRAAAERETTLDLPEDIEPLQPSLDATLDVVDTLYEKRSYRGLVYGLIAVVLAVGLATQLAWQYREELLAEFPALNAVCEHIACRPEWIRAPDQLRILQRDILPTENETGSLTLSTHFRNEAELPQPMPDIQLSLIDNNGKVLVRRRLAPADYLFPPPPDDQLIAPGEVVTISVDFKDPGFLATGFVIDFL